MNIIKVYFFIASIVDAKQQNPIQIGQASQSYFSV